MKEERRFQHFIIINDKDARLHLQSPGGRAAAARRERGEKGCRMVRVRQTELSEGPSGSCGCCLLLMQRARKRESKSFRESQAAHLSGERLIAWLAFPFKRTG
ncbi:hypothetical protein AOLI_G00306580 [Acnodon oligacanthus]